MDPTSLDIPLACVFHERLLTVERYATALRFLGLKSGDVVAMRLDPAAPEAIRARRACWRVGAAVVLLPEEAHVAPVFDALSTLVTPTLLIGRWGEEKALDGLGEQLNVEYVLTVGPEGEGCLDDFAVLADSRFETDSGPHADLVVWTWIETHEGGQWQRLSHGELGIARTAVVGSAEMPSLCPVDPLIDDDIVNSLGVKRRG